MVLKRRSSATGVARWVPNRSTFTEAGISGAPCAIAHRSNPLYLETNSGSVAHYGVGGIFTAEDAWEDYRRC